MEGYKVSATLQLKIDHLDDRIKKFELLLDEQVSELGAGKIVKSLRSALKQFNNGIVFVSFEVLHRLMIYKFIEIDYINGRNYFDKCSIFASNAMPDNNFIIAANDLKLETEITLFV